jgi:nucleotide-binding universal stress UspA family protein
MMSDTKSLAPNSEGDAIMFKHVLIPTDGSPLARKAIKAGVKLAKELGARVTFYHAFDATPAYAAGEFITPSVMEQIDAGAHKHAQKCLGEAARMAEAVSVPCETVSSNPQTAYRGIVEAARRRKCDVIFMAAHGRGEVASLVLGSVTIKVLAHSKLPVLVFR